MNADMVKYSGVFLFYPKNNHKTTKLTGLLYRDTSGETIIEVFDRPEGGNLLEEHHKIVWGKVGNEDFSFFDVHLVFYSEYSSIKYSVKYAIQGRKMASIKERRFNGCKIGIPHLIHWVNIPFSITCGQKEDPFISDNSSKPFLQTDLAKMKIQFFFNKSVSRTPNSVTYSKDCFVKCDSSNNQSVDDYLKLTTVISRFVSFAMLWKQECNFLELYAPNNDTPYHIWLPVRESSSLKRYHLFSFQDVKDKIHIMLQKWYKHYSELQPMVNQLLFPLSYVDFDYIVFLRFAHALEGLHKRFQSNVFNRIAIEEKKSEEEDFYKARIKNLKDHLLNLKIISECNIDENLVTKARNKYTHLGIKDVKDDIPNDTLYLLALKCKVLLACSILLVLGLSEQEIEKCTHNSELKNIVNYICVKENREIRF